MNSISMLLGSIYTSFTLIHIIVLYPLSILLIIPHILANIALMSVFILTPEHQQFLCCCAVMLYLIFNIAMIILVLYAASIVITKYSNTKSQIKRNKWLSGRPCAAVSIHHSGKPLHNKVFQKYILLQIAKLLTLVCWLQDAQLIFMLFYKTSNPY